MEKIVKRKSQLSIWTILTSIFICFGVLLRVKQYLCNRSLWFDEANLALNIVNRSFSGLFQPLDYNQGAPIGFLIIEKLLVQFFGNSEYVLRLFPFLCGVISLFLFYKVAKHYIERKAVPIALGLFALSNSLIYYSSEVKQYSSDVLLALFLLLITIYIQSKRLDTLRVVLFGFIGAATIWFSHPALFILAGIGVSSILFCLVHKEWSKIFRLSVIYSIWLLSFVICYSVSLGDLAHNKVLLDFWSGSFMPFPPRPSWLVKAFFNIFSDPVALPLEGIAALTFLIGCITIFLKKKREFFLLILPMFFVLAASGFHKYPFRGRLLLFIVPIVVLFIAEGTEHVRVKTFNISPMIGVILIGLLFSYPLYNAYSLFKACRGGEEIKPVMSYIRENQQSGDILYLYYGSNAAFEYYAKRYNFADNSYIIGVNSRSNWRNYLNDLNKLCGNERVWVLFSHVWSWEGVNEDKFFLYHLDTIGTRLDSFKREGAAVYLYDLSKN